MHIIIGDIGNTVTKICLIDVKNFNIKKIVYVDSAKVRSTNFLIKTFKKIISKKLFIKSALFSSVVPRNEIFIRNFLSKNYQISFKEIKEKSLRKIIKINIKNKKQVGSDRIANAVGVYKKYKSNCIVLDFGTATTFDVVRKNGIYDGGVISPGVNLSIKSLANFADQIPIFSLNKPKKIIGKNTKDALRAGFFWGYVGLINGIISKIEKETKLKYKIIFTGGYADLFKTSIIRSFKIDKNITIYGIIEIFKHNIKQFN